MKWITNLLGYLFIVLIAVVMTGSTAQPQSKSHIVPLLKSAYPHWNFNKKDTYAKLLKINAFIEKNKNKNNIAIFDWDGTLYNENIPVKELNNIKYAGQPAWYMWMALNKDKFNFAVFPMFITEDGDFLKNVINFNKYLENETNIPSHGFSKFIATPLFTAGMTPQSVTDGVMSFLKVYKPEKYAFLPMLDIMQKMVDSGYNVWIITGSNQYFVASQIQYIEKNINYTKNKKYNFKISTAPYNPETGHIAGNGLKLMKNGNISVVYDNRYVKNPYGKLYIVDEQGKAVVARNLEKKNNSKVVFAAGNSGGDYNGIKYVLQKPDTLVIAVEPRGDLPKLIEEYPGKIVQFNSDEI
ncbi:MAG: hypothetical protein GY710_04595 [Desulfobacteraceae bacterium]|nr:hypothetical protein [Desulfobacteraceae bacterium]